MRGNADRLMMLGVLGVAVLAAAAALYWLPQLTSASGSASVGASATSTAPAATSTPSIQPSPAPTEAATSTPAIAAATVTGVAITSTAPREGGGPAPYPAAANIDVDVTFSDPVTVTGAPTLGLGVGSRTRQAAYRSATANTVSFRYAVTGADRDDDGISIAANALTLNGGAIRAGGVDVSLGLGSYALGAQAAHRVHGGGASFDGVAAPAYTFETGTLKTVTLPEADNADKDCRVDQSDPASALIPGCSPYSLAATPSLPHGLTFDASSRVLEGSPTMAMATTTYTLIAESPLGSDSLPFTIQVAYSRPAVSGVSITSVPASASNYATDENIDVDVTFSRPVNVTGTPRLALGIGTNTRQAQLRAAFGATLSFRYQVTADDVDVDGVSIAAGALTLNGGTITAATGGRAARLGLGAHVVSNSASHKVNDSAPTFGTATVESRGFETNTAIAPIKLPAATGGDGSLTYDLTPATLPDGLTFTASTRTIAGTPTVITSGETYITSDTTYTWRATDADGDTAQLTFTYQVLNPSGPAPSGIAVVSTEGNYENGDVLSLTVTYSERMEVIGTPYLTLDVGGSARRALYDAAASYYGSGKHTMFFGYTIQPGDFDGDGVAVAADALRRNGGIIRRLRDNADARVGLGSHAIASGDATSATMRVNDTAPSFGTTTVDNRLYDINTAITPIVLPAATGDGSLTYDLAPTTLPDGMTWTAATRTIAGTPSAVTSSQTYTWKATDGDGDAAELTFSIEVWEPSGPAADEVGVYTATSGGDSPPTNYWPGDTIRVAVVYPSPLTITGSPQLTLIIGDRRVKASYDATTSAQRNVELALTGRGGLVFQYAVQSGDWDGDGIAIPADALLLNGGTIRTTVQHGSQDVQLNLGNQAVASGSRVSRAMRVADTSPSLPDGDTIDDQTIVLNQAVSVSLVDEVNGDAPFTYRITPALPAGLSLGTPAADGGSVAPDAPDIVGQTSVAVSSVTYTLTATDRDGDSATLGTFRLSTVDTATVDEVEILSSPYANNTYGAGEVIEVAVGFDRGITLILESQSTLLLNVGGTTRSAAYTDLDADGRLVYTYTVAASDRDTDGISIAAASLRRNGAIIRDTDTRINAELGLGRHAVPNDASHQVDGAVATPMAVEAVAIVSAPASADGYDAGEVIKARVTFSKPPTVTGPPQLALNIGNTQRPARYRPADSSRDYVGFSYTVATRDRDTDGISIVASALGLHGGTIRDAGGSDAALGLGTHAIANAAAHKVHTPPRVTGLSILSNPGVNGTYDAGEAIRLQLAFSELTITSGFPQVALTIGENTRQAVWTFDITGQGRRHLYEYVVTADDLDGDGISIGADALNLPAGALIRANSNLSENAALSLGTHAVTNDAAHTVRDTMPSFGVIQPQHYIAGTAVDATLPAPGGDGVITYTLSPTLPGGLSHTTTATSTPPRITGTPTTAGGPTTYTLTATDGDGDTGSAEFTITVAASDAPRVTDVRIFSSPRAGSDNTYEVEPQNPILVDVQFDQEVNLTGSPQLGLEIGAQTVQMNKWGSTGYAVRGSPLFIDRTTLRFEYYVQAADRDRDGISIHSGALTLNGGTITSSGTGPNASPSGVNASLGLGSHAISNDAGHKVDGGLDAPPFVAGVDMRRFGLTVPPAGYKPGDAMRVCVRFSEAITLVGNPKLALQVGVREREATFSQVTRTAGSNSPYRGICFDYAFRVDDYDHDGVSVGDTLDTEGNVTAYALRLSGATIRNVGGTDANLALGTQAVVNDAEFVVFSPPKITAVSVISTPNQEGTYSWEADLKIAIDYDQAVTYTPEAGSVEGMRLALGVASGDQDVYRAALDSVGSRVVFKHDVMYTDRDADGVSLTADALKLQGGTLQDSDGEDAQIDLTGFTFTNQSDTKLDGTKAGLWPNFATETLTVSNPAARTASSVSLPSPGGDLPLSWSVAPALPAGLTMNAVTGVISGTATAETPLREYTVTVEDGVGVPAGGTGYFDYNNGDTDTAKFRMRVTGARPVVTGVSFIGAPPQNDTYAAGEEIVVGVSFGTDTPESITVTGAPELALGIGSATVQATYYQTVASTRTLYFRYTVDDEDLDTDGISIAEGALTIGTQAAIRSARGENAVTALGVHTIANAAGHKVNGGITRAPTVTGVLVTSEPARGNIYHRGEEIEVRVEFSQAVEVVGAPTLGMTIGSATRQASYARVGLSPRYHTFRYLVQQSDVDYDDFYTTANALTYPTSAHIRNEAGVDVNIGILSTATLLSRENIDGGTNRAAFVQGIRITSSPAAGDTYNIGETITAQLRFSKPVTVTGTPSVAVSMASGIGSATYTRSVRGQQTAGLGNPYYQWLEFSYTVAGGDYDADGISIEETYIDRILGILLPESRRYWLPPLALDAGATIVGTGDGGVAAQLNVRLQETVTQVLFGISVPGTTIIDNSLRNQGSHKVNGRQPTVTAFNFWGIPDNVDRCNDPVRSRATSAVCDEPGRRDPGGYVEGEPIDTLATFSEPVIVSGNPRVALTMASGTVLTTLWSQLDPARNDYTKLLFRYRVQSGDSDSDGISITQDALTNSAGGSIRSRATGNPAVLTLPAALPNQPYQTVLNAPPTAARILGIGFPTAYVTLSAPYANSTYELDEYIDMAVAFDKPVDITGSPQLSFTIGSTTRTAGFQRGGTTVLHFRYLVQAGDVDTDGVSLPANALSLNGGTITTRGNSLAANIESAAVSDDSGRKVDGGQDGAPGVTSVEIRSNPVVGNTYGDGETVEVVVRFHKRLTVTGSPQLGLTLGSQTALASHSVPDDRTIRFQYRVKPPDRDLNGLSVGASALSLNGGTIASRSGTNANLGLGSSAITDNGHHRVDGRIQNVPNFGAAVVADKSWRVNTSVSDTLPAAAGGRGGVAYSISPALPAGLSFNNATRVISGSPTAVTARRSYTLTAQDGHNRRDRLSFSITITPNPAPGFGDQTIGDKIYTQNTAITAFKLPEATGDDTPLTYTLTPALPAGVTRDTTTHWVSGTPTAAMTRTQYTWTATDSGGDQASLNFDITVNAGPMALTDRTPTFGTQSVADQTGLQGSAITTFYLPAATGGDGTLTYTLSPALPAGVTRSATAPYGVSGTPSVALARTQYTWTATDADGDTASLAFHVTITADLTPYFSALVANQRWVRGDAITAFTLPAGAGGNGALTYALSPALPGGVSKSASHEVSGTPTAAMASTQYTWTVTDADGDQGSVTFSIAVGDIPSFGTATIANQLWTQRQAIAGFTLPTATGGDGTLTYTISPALPAGTSKNASHQVSGTPTGHQTATTYTWKVTDADGDTAQLTFTIAIAEDLSPSFSTTIGNKTWTQNQAIAAFTLPTATGGDGTLTYALSPALPAGVSKSDSHEVSGTPTALQSATTYTWKATDADGDAAELTFTITIGQDLAPSFSTTIPNQTWTQNTAITAFTLPTASGGDGSLSYALSPALPAGVSKNASHEVSGTPTGYQAATTYTWKATDADGDAVELTFTITIAQDLAPSFSTTIDNQSWTQNQAITAFTLPTASGGDGSLTYALSPALPAGVSKNASHRVSGTPTGHQTATTYTWKVTDADGDAAQLTFTIAIAQDRAPSFGTATIGNKTWTQRQAITAFTLPAATGGDGSLTYTLSPALPAGVSKNASHEVSGTPSGYQAAATYTWKATDADGDAAQLTFTITIAQDLAPSFSETISNKTWTQNMAITAFTLPTATGGDGALTYDLSPTLPAGVSKDDSHEVSGTPTSHQTATTYTWKATDADGDAVELTFTITIAEDLAPSFSTTIGDKTWTQNQQITAFTLPTASGGDGSLTYTLSPALPAGVSKNASHEVSGTPTSHQTATTYTWKATDADGDKAELTFTITIAEDLAPSFSTTISNQTWTQNQAISAFTLPTATGGDGSLTYTLSPSLPAGVSKNASHEVSGTPTSHQTATTYTWKATDADGDAAQLTFTITITEDLSPSFSATIPNQTWTQNQAITAFTLPTATGGDGSLTYALSPALPAGVSKSDSHAVSGTPTGHQAAATYTWKATDADGDAVELTFTITIAEDLSPSFSTTIGDKTWTQNQAITAFTLPTATGGDGSLTYTLSPALPAGVSKNASHRVSGTPTGHQAAATYTWKATDADGDAVELTFTITIAEDLAPTFSTTIADQTWTQRQAITAFTLPTATGGDGSLTYALSPTLPAGVSKDDSHRISGTPTGHQTAATYTWKATDADGDAVQLTFTITIAEDLAPSFSTTIPNQTWTQNQAITGFTLPTASGGDGNLTYALSPALPAGVSKNASHEVSGTPTGHQAATTYTWKATDADGDAVQLTFTITIAEDLAPTFSTTIADQTWTQRQAITAFTLPTATGGDGALTYALSPTLPAGVSKSDSHEVSGTPTGHQAATTYTWKATDADGDAAQLTFTITIAEDLAPSFGAAIIANKSWTQNQAITGFTLPTATGGDGSLTYALSPALPAGVSKNASHEVSGTPTSHQTATAYTWKVTDADGDAVELTFTIAIAQDLEPSFSTTIANQTWTQNQAITGFTLPTATGGDGSLTYALSPTLPAGVSKNASHEVSGTPTGHQAATTYTWKATDADGDAVELTFTITIAEDLAPTFSTTIGNKTWTQNQAITGFTLPTATGGDGSLTYALSPALPAGVSKNASHEVSGTPTGHQAAATYTWKATDVDGDEAELTFTITIAEDLAPSFSTTIGDKTWTQNQQITAFTLPTATGGDGSLTYALSPTLPAGVTKDASHQVSGTPTGHQTATTYTWKATDADGDTAELTFTITIAEDLSPSFGAATIAAKTWTQRQAITAFTLPTATGGDSPLTYTISPALPAGVSKNASHEVSGTPTGHQAATTYTWKVTDSDGDAVELTFTITIAEDLSPSFGATTIANQTWTQRQAITAFTLPTATGGDSPLTYDLSPGLPAGVSKNASHRISGTPTGHQAATTYTWKATDADGDMVELTFTITIAEDLAPTFSTTIGDKTWTQNQAITAFTLPTASGGDGSLTYALSPALPAGVSKSDSHAVSGTPTGHQTAATYTWKVTDADGDAVQLTFTITIAEDLAPSFSTTIGNKTWTQNQAIAGFTLPTASGGDGALTYTISPALPAGVTKNASHAVSGTPTGHQTATTYTWKVTDADGDAVQLTFTITIAEDLAPSFSTTIGNKTWTQNQAIAGFTLPTATGGDGNLTYTLSPDLPTGVTKNASHEVSGTPTGHQTATAYTWKATDADGDAAELTFTITIAQDLAPSFSETISNQTWTQRQAITAFTLPTASGGDGTLTYALSPTLPAGVTKNASHEVSGTPTGHQTATTYTWKATDADGDAAELTFTITIAQDLAPSFSETISNQTWTQRQAITAFTLPTASGGDGSLTYTLSPALPAGVSKDDSHEVSGTPTSHQTAATYTWKATDADGDEAQLTFTITIAEDLSPSFGAATIGNKTWTQNMAITAFTLPTATGGDGSLTYALSPALPAGVSKNASHEVSGTPTGHQTATTYTWKATDADGDTAQLTFTIAIAQDLEPSFSTTIANQTWTQNQAITAFTLPTATGGDGTLTYTLSPALPAGVSKNASHEVSGTPTGHQAATTYTWKATDADGDAVELTFTITIAEDLAPTFSTTIADQTWTQRQAITAFTLPTATGGDGLLTYALSPTLPAGVTKNASHRVSGTPTGHQAETTYTWKATDGDGDAAELTFTITIAEDLSPSFGTATIADKTWTQRQAITAFTLPTATGGDGSLTYALSPALPAGITKNASHEVSGTPTGHQAAITYTWKATDADGDTAELTFTITIAQDLAPSFSETISNQTWTQNQQITALTLPTATGGDGSLTYALSPALPAGVTKNASHEVSGTPTGHQTAATYTWKATDADGDAVELTFTITIAEDLAPSFGAQTVADKSWTQRQAITAFTLPTATGGDGSLTYTLSPALPAGVTKNASHRVSGTPTGHQTEATYTWKATDGDGDAAELTFTITIAEDLAPMFSTTIGDKTWTQNQQITAFTLPTATGGDGSLTYALSPSLPAGVSKNDSHEVSGTPTGHQTATTYTWKVTDADGDAAQLTFTITIAEDLAPSFGSQTIGNKSWTQNQAITGFTLPTATGGDGSLTYALSPALPAGVTKNASHEVSGTPTGHQAATTYTWKATDADGDAVQLTFTITIADDLAPTFSTTIGDKTWTQNQQITAFTLPTATGGDGSLTYALSPTLPDGVTKDASHRVSGTPTGHQTATTYTWKATDADSDAVQLTFTITIAKDLAPSFGAATIGNKTWTQNQAIAGFTLPTASGGDSPLTYTISPALPAGVTKNASHEVSGTPTGHQTAATYTWKATDADGDAAELTFTITIAEDLSPSFSTTIPNQSWTQRQAITAFTLPTATGGDGSLTYTISPTLPAGVTKSASHEVSGAPTGHQTAATYTWKATDSDGDAAQLTFTITIAEDLVPMFSTTIADQTWTQRQAITAFTLPTATGGDGNLTYALSPAVPAGVSKNASHQVSGTPTGHQAATTYTWKATDVDGDEAELTFTITIAEDLAPSFSTTIPNQTWTQRQAITAFTLPTASGGDGSLTYALSPTLPDGVTKDASHEVSGTPTGHQSATTYTWKVTDADGDAAQLTFTIAIAEDLSPSFSTTIGDKTWTQNQQITAFTLPTATGGDGSLTYALSPALPTGVSKSASHEVSGTPTGHQTATTYTWKATDGDGDAVQLTFTITIAQDLAPSFGSQSIDNKTWTQRQAITAFTLPAATGGDSPLTYALSPSLPAGVTKNASHEVSGTPTGHQTATTYTWKATDTDGDAAELTFTITIAEDLSPSFGAATIANQSWTQNQAITAFTLPTATGGDSPLTYTISPALPAGVTKNASHRISGTPTGHQAATTYTWKATDADGDAVELTFTITIAEDLSPSFSTTISDKTWTQRQAITAFTLPTATGGDGSLTYALSPTLPAGVSKDDNHRISGTPTGHQAATTYTWKATDADGDAVELTFTITIAEDLSPSFGSATIADQSWRQYDQMTAFTLPIATGGDGSLTYTLSPALPAGVTRDATTRVVSGMPSVKLATTEYTWTARDTDGDTASLTFNISVNGVPSFGSQSIPDQHLWKDSEIAAFNLPLATGGDGSLTYALTPALPDGVTNATTTPYIVSGTPTAYQARTKYTWTATDGDGDTASLTFRIRVDALAYLPTNPLLFFDTIEDKSWTQRQPITAFTLPEATGGDGTLTYTLSPALPAGVSKDDNHRISGTPTAYQARTKYTWTVTDGDGDTASLTFRISVDALAYLPANPLLFFDTIEDKSWTQRQPITAFTLPEAAGGDGTLTYTLSPALPAGVSKNASHRVSGTPSVKQARTQYTWTARDADGDTASLTFHISVDGVPSFGAQAIADQSWTQRQPITAFTLPEATGGDGALTYTLSPALPAGVGRDDSHEVSGAPSVHQGKTAYTWKATDTDGDEAELSFTITIAQSRSPIIAQDLAPTFGEQSIDNQTWTQNQQITALTLPTATGGDGTLTYTLSPALPAGVSKSDSHRVNGAPSVHQGETAYTWKATDADGDEAELSFTITIAEDLSPSFATTIGDKAWTQNQPITAFTLPEATGGDGNLTYRLSPALPAGVSRDDSHEVSGTPTGHQAATTYTWKATDADGDAAQLTFKIRVASAGPRPTPTLPPTEVPDEILPLSFSDTIEDKSWMQNRALTPFMLPPASGGSGELKYTLRPDLPSGVARDAVRRVSGRPEAPMARTPYTWRVSDERGETASLSFYITVMERSAQREEVEPTTQPAPTPEPTTQPAPTPEPATRPAAAAPVPAATPAPTPAPATATPMPTLTPAVATPMPTTPMPTTPMPTTPPTTRESTASENLLTVGVAPTDDAGHPAGPPAIERTPTATPTPAAATPTPTPAPTSTPEPATPALAPTPTPALPVAQAPATATPALPAAPEPTPAATPAPPPAPSAPDRGVSSIWWILLLLLLVAAVAALVVKNRRRLGIGRSPAAP